MAHQMLWQSAFARVSFLCAGSVLLPSESPNLLFTIITVVETPWCWQILTHKDLRKACPGQDLNLHASRRYHLKVVRLPIPPPGLVSWLVSRCRGGLYAGRTPSQMGSGSQGRGRIRT